LLLRRLGIDSYLIESLIETKVGCCRLLRLLGIDAPFNSVGLFYSDLSLTLGLITEVYFVKYFFIFSGLSLYLLNNE